MSKRTPRLLLRGAVVGEYGKTYVISLKNFEDEAQDVSAYTGLRLHFESPDGRKTITSTGAFVTDGSDALLSWSFDSDAPLDREGIWAGQAELDQVGQKSKSYVFDLEVDRSLS